MLRGSAFASSSRVAAVRPAISSRASTVVVRAVQDLQGKVRRAGLSSAATAAAVAAAVISGTGGDVGLAFDVRAHIELRTVHKPACTSLQHICACKLHRAVPRHASLTCSTCAPCCCFLSPPGCQQGHAAVSGCGSGAPVSTRQVLQACAHHKALHRTR